MESLEILLDAFVFVLALIIGYNASPPEASREWSDNLVPGGLQEDELSDALFSSLPNQKEFLSPPSFDELAQMLKSIKDNDREERSLPRVLVTCTSPVTLRSQILSQKEEWKRRQRDEGNPQARQTCIGNKTYYSTRPLHSLTPIHLCDMHARQHHEGSTFYAEWFLHLVSRIASVSFAIEDVHGWSQMVSVHNFPGTQDANEAELDTIFPEDAVIAIREPYCRMEAEANQSYIRVDSPSDLVFLEPGHPLLLDLQWTTGDRQLPVLRRSETEWKAVADKHFKAKEYFAAVVSYSYAIQRSTSPLKLHLNRSLTHLRLGNFAAALRDAQAVLENQDITQDERIKALYRSAQAEYREGHYGEAKNLYIKCLKISPDLKDAKIGISNCDLRLKEQSKGQYDWASLFLKSKSELALDVAEFTGPIEIAEMENRGGGRGIRATRDIKPSELLVVAKPFAVSNPEDFMGLQKFPAFNFLTDRVDKETQYMVHQKTIFKVAYQPSASAVYKLYGGEQFQPITHPDTSLPLDNPLHFSSDINTAHIHAVCSLSSFGFGKPLEIGNSQPIDPYGSDISTALYILPSYFNHSCVANAAREHFGDIMVIRALVKIKRGEEITITYHGYGAPFERRKEDMSKWVEECDCRLCQQDQLSGALQRERRRAIREEVFDPDAPIDRIRELIKELEGLYPETYGSFRFELSECHLALVNRLQMAVMASSPMPPPHSLYEEIIQSEISALEAMQIQVTDKEMTRPRRMDASRLPISTNVVPYHNRRVTQLCLSIVAYFLHLGIGWRAERWIAAAIWIDNARSGGGGPLFKLRYGDSLTRLFDPAWEQLLTETERYKYMI